ncbi:(2Fe-2S) ferredoxin domain-containing protein [Thermotalea metallivorans]|uniref:NADP-reducing hydrogenase subunit HndB n=1 Tax=Thermotalea metallivorans TaxID=520762 RepID=A0A140KZL7_9FIRM|nr:(2Fe-2S) ferredoxin domain-containing protein [Thermotalea metallivorans]KXG73742.1 NADP-reducing hydrogenase subunit HndB [Thermotalea metallivorans]
MTIKSLEELIKIREGAQKKVNLRQSGDDGEDIIEILVGMATCGIAAGARETLHAIIEEINHREIKNIRVVPVGCLGYCHSEPVIQVNIPGEEPILYGKVDSNKAKEIIHHHILGGNILKDSVLINTFQRA